MKKEPKALGTISRGYARNDSDEKRLRAKGVKTIYRADKGETLGKFKMRAGEILGVVDGLRVFGDTRRDILAAIRVVHAMDATVVDAEDGLRSDRHWPEMIDRALAKFRPTPEQARAMQEASMVARLKGKKIMPRREAAAIWHDARFSTVEAIELMFGWAQATAYKYLGKRNVPAGRRPK
jgi:hypothetical protein